MKGVIILFLLGALFGPIGDMCHVISETTHYPADVYGFYIFDLIPWWVPPLFGTATAFIGLTHAKLDPSKKPGMRNAKLVFLAAFIFLMAYCLSGFLTYADIILPVLAILTWVVLDRSKLGALLAVGTAVVGTTAEVFLVQNGIFSYLPHVDHLFGVAAWLPWLYVIASVTVGNLGRYLLK